MWHQRIATWITSLDAHDATHLDIYFLPSAGSFPVLGWSPDAVSQFMASSTNFALGRPTIEQLVEYRSDDMVMLRSPSPDVAPRVARVTPITPSVNHDNDTYDTHVALTYAHGLRVESLSPHAFPSKREYDSLRFLSRARWSLHNRAKLHIDRTNNEATIYIRYTHSKNVDTRALCAILSRGITTLTSALYK